MRRPRLVALLCLLALFAPAAAVLAQALGQPSCADNCCDSDDCGDTGEQDCPDDCPDCACSAAARIAVPSPCLTAPAPEALVVAELVEPAPSPEDGCPRGILHVPRRHAPRA